ncbi:MAG: hypothetical protein EBY65_01195 [Acidimicrobiia bacterium]|nr:hypothetical protein [Acidimicrobiia bacterium]
MAPQRPDPVGTVELRRRGLGAVFARRSTCHERWQRQADLPRSSRRLNELECVDGHVIANIWQSPMILVIRPDGRAVATIDGTPLVDEIGSTAPSREVLNGIAVRDETSFWLTGKQWPTLFAIGVAPNA